MYNPNMQKAGAGGSPNQMNVGMVGSFGGAPMFGGMGGMGAMGSQMQQPMFGVSSMNRSPLGGMGQERSGEYTPIEGQPGYFTNPDGYRYKKKGPHYIPADPVGPNYYQQPRPAQRLPEWFEYSNPLHMVNPFRLLPGILGG